MKTADKKEVGIPPVAFIIFNRPKYAQNVLNVIRKVRPKQLFVIADGPRSPKEVQACEATRAIIDQVDWDCKVYKNYAEKNMGLKKRISSGLDWFFENVESGIILEDDCLPHPSFFKFAGEMLEQYKNDERISMITGDNFLPELKINSSYFFSRYFSIWGWATWRRAWKNYDIQIKNWGESTNKKKLKKMYTQPYMVKHASKIFDAAYSGKLDTWDVQWLYTCLMSGGLCVTPSVNLISNIGILGTHSSGSNQNLPVFDLYAKEFRHPISVALHAEYDDMFYEKNFLPHPKSISALLRTKAIEIAVRYTILKKIYRLLIPKK